MKSAIFSPGKSASDEAGEYESCFYNNGFFHTLFLCELTGITIFSIWQHDVPTREPVCGVILERSSLTNIIRSFQPDIRVPHANRWTARNSIPAGERIIIFLQDPIMSGAGVFMLR
jgi:predicted glycosyltransferase